MVNQNTSSVAVIVMRVNDPMETDRIRQVKNLLKMKKQIRLKIIILLSDPGSKLSVASRGVFKRQEIGDNGTKSLSEPDLQQRGDGPQPTMLRVNNSPANPTTEFQAADASLLKISINQTKFT